MKLFCLLGVYCATISNMKRIHFLFLFCVALIVTASCSPNVVTPVATLKPTLTVVISTPTSTPSPSLWISPAAPQQLRNEVLNWGIPLEADRANASIRVDVGTPNASRVSNWIYALVAPFPTLMDEVSSQDLRDFWNGSSQGPFNGAPLLMDESTLAAFTALWGAPAARSARSVGADQLLDAAWSQMPAWAIIPFESLQPRWKVLSVDGQSPIEKQFDAATYPLAITFHVESSTANVPNISSTNRDPSKLTTVIVTGVTALTRATAAAMEKHGVTYPGQDTRDMFREADITHISSEVSFYTGCPYPDIKKTIMIFCSSPRYVGLLLDIGADVVELTGNHLADYGVEPINETLKIYKQNHIPYYGGGENIEDARKPALFEVNGNKIAFLGCNRADIGHHPVAKKDRPGASPCDYEYLTKKIAELRKQEYIVIFTFQYFEEYEPLPYPDQIKDFRMMADAGANIVSGSQAHFPQTMEMYNDSFIHYGLGNLFFDQMDIPTHGTRREFVDRYTIYDGRVLSAQLITLLLEDYARPCFMTKEERDKFLLEYFIKSGWDFPQAVEK